MNVTVLSFQYQFKKQQHWYTWITLYSKVHSKYSQELNNLLRPKTLKPAQFIFSKVMVTFGQGSLLPASLMSYPDKVNFIDQYSSFYFSTEAI